MKALGSLCEPSPRWPAGLARVVSTLLGCTLFACQGGGQAASAGADSGKHAGDAGSAPAQAAVAYLSPTEHLTRASIALRGVRPSLDELAAVRKDARYVEAIVDYYLTTPEFGATIRELHEEALLTSVDPVIYPAGFPAIGPLAGRSLQALNSSVIEAPLRLIEHVVVSDRPYTEIVTANYAFADDAVAAVFGMPYDPNGPGWQETTFGDDRPAAGILSDSFLFTRHSTTYSNKSRGRANAISRALLCYDFLSREIPIDSGINLADPNAVSDAVRNNPACVSCHQTLDPLAGYFSPYYPIYVPSDLKQYPFQMYEPAFRQVFRAADPGYFGVASGDLGELGASIAKDPRFSLCAAKRFYSYLAEVELEAVPLELASQLQGVLIDSGMSAKALAKAVVMSDAFRSAYALSDEGADALVGLKKMRPSQLARSVAALTGYHFATTLPIEIVKGAGKVGDVDLMGDSFFGFKVLAGGIDGNSVTRPSHTWNATVALTVANLAARAADAVVDSDFAQAMAQKRRLLRSVEPSDSDESALRAQLAELETRFYGEAADPQSESVTSALELLRAASAANGGDGARAWKLTLSAMLQDIRMQFY